MTTVTFWHHALALAIGLILPAYAARQQARADRSPFEPWQKIATYWANGLFLVALAGVAVLVWSAGGTLRSLGLTAPPEPLGPGLVLGAAALAGYALDAWWQLSAPHRAAATRAHWRRRTPFLPATAREVRHALALVVAAATAEEILYRGFLIGYLAHFLGPSPPGLTAAVALPALVFGASHLYQGGHAVMKIVLLAGVLGAIVVVTGSLWIPVAVHFVVDLTGVLLAPSLLAPPPAADEVPLP